MRPLCGIPKAIAVSFVYYVFSHAYAINYTEETVGEAIWNGVLFPDCASLLCSVWA